jgi:hypothetical protein
MRAPWDGDSEAGQTSTFSDRAFNHSAEGDNVGVKPEPNAMRYEIMLIIAQIRIEKSDNPLDSRLRPRSNR